MLRKCQIVLFIFVFFHTALFGQGCEQGFYPFKYKIIMDTVPDQYIISYTNKDTIVEHISDSIKLIVIDEFYNTYYHGFFIMSPDDTLYVDMLDTDCVVFKYYQNFKIKPNRLGSQSVCNVQDTGITHRIFQITVVIGMHEFVRHTIYSKFPLTRKKIEIIRKYAYNNGAEPLCVKKKRCWISAPEI